MLRAEASVDVFASFALEDAMTKVVNEAVHAIGGVNVPIHADAVEVESALSTLGGVRALQLFSGLDIDQMSPWRRAMSGVGFNPNSLCRLGRHQPPPEHLKRWMAQWYKISESFSLVRTAEAIDA